MKTAIQQLIEKLSTQAIQSDDDTREEIHYKQGISEAISICYDFIKTERSQTIDAYIDGFSATEWNVDSDKYYSETFES